MLLAIETTATQLYPITNHAFSIGQSDANGEKTAANAKGPDSKYAS